MNAMRLNLKLFPTADSGLEPRALVPVFHGWIQRRAIDNELLIDVADYTHVVDGPGVMLIGHEGHYAYERLQGKPGFSYSLRRAEIADGFEPALRYAMRQLLTATSLLEAEESLAGKLRFDTGRLQVQINDRLRAPNEARTWTALEPEARRVLGALFDSGVQIEPAAPGLSLFTLSVRAQASLSERELLARV
jgi:hypothetical protein